MVSKWRIVGSKELALFKISTDRDGAEGMRIVPESSNILSSRMGNFTIGLPSGEDYLVIFINGFDHGRLMSEVHKVCHEGGSLIVERLIEEDKKIKGIKEAFESNVGRWKESELEKQILILGKWIKEIDCFNGFFRNLFKLDSSLDFYSNLRKDIKRFKRKIEGIMAGQLPDGIRRRHRRRHEETSDGVPVGEPVLEAAEPVVPEEDGACVAIGSRELTDSEKRMLRRRDGLKALMRFTIKYNVDVVIDSLKKVFRFNLAEYKNQAKGEAFEFMRVLEEIRGRFWRFIIEEDRARIDQVIQSLESEEKRKNLEYEKEIRAMTDQDLKKEGQTVYSLRKIWDRDLYKAHKRTILKELVRRESIEKAFRSKPAPKPPAKKAATASQGNRSRDCAAADSMATVKKVLRKRKKTISGTTSSEDFGSTVYDGVSGENLQGVEEAAGVIDMEDARRQAEERFRRRPEVETGGLFEAIRRKALRLNHVEESDKNVLGKKARSEKAKPKKGLFYDAFQEIKAGFRIPTENLDSHQDSGRFSSFSDQDTQ